MLTLRAVSSYLSAPFASKSLRSMAAESHLSKRLLFGEQVFEPEKLSVYESTHSIPPAGEILPKPHYIDFNTRALACAAADAISSNLPPRLSWFDWGGYNSVFLLTFNDGTESGVPPKMSSVVATMTFARYYCGIPCPRVLAWNSSGDNPVGAPYILMEKAEGEYPYARWGTVSEDRRLALFDQLAKYQAQYARPLPFSQIGSIYFASPHLAEQRNIDDLDLGDPALYRVGPLAKGPGRLNHLAGLSSPSSSVRELWRDYVSSERAAAIAKWGSCRTTVIDVEEDQPDLDSEDEHTMGELLDAAEAIESMIATCPLPTDERLLAPCLVMNDYACRNVLSDPDSMQITSFIDWDEVALLPFFLCTRFPEEIADCPGAPLEWRQRHGAAYGCADFQGSVDPEDDYYHMHMTYQKQRNYYKERLRAYDGRFNAELMRMRGDLLYIHYVVSHGWGRWMSPSVVNWMKERVNEIDTAS